MPVTPSSFFTALDGRVTLHLCSDRCRQQLLQRSGAYARSLANLHEDSHRVIAYFTMEAPLDGQMPTYSRVLGVVHRREIVGLWVPSHLSSGILAHVVAGDAASRGVRRRTEAHLALVRPDASLSQALQRSVDVVLLDATEREVSLDAWARVAAGRAQGATVGVLTRSAADAYRCDRTVLAAWSFSELRFALGSLIEGMQAATRDLLAGAQPPRRATVLATMLQRTNRAVRDAIDLARQMARSEDERLDVQELAGRAAGAMVDERVLEKLLAEAEGH
jgi:hypothetical protein